MMKSLRMQETSLLRNICPWFDYFNGFMSSCEGAVDDGRADVIIVQAEHVGRYKKFETMKPILYEEFDESYKYVLTADIDITYKELLGASL